MWPALRVGIRARSLRTNGTVFAIGSNLWPDESSSLTNATAVAAGDYYSMALRAMARSLSGGGTVHQTNVPPGVSNVVAITAGARMRMRC